MSQKHSFKNNTHSSRWNDANSYSRSWVDRSNKLLDLFLKHEFDSHAHYRVAEFGCGPYSPFHSACKSRLEFEVCRYDMTRWDAGVSQIDLNQRDIEFPEADIFVFSGVLEYLNDIPKTLKLAMNNCNYMLLSNAFFPAAIT